MSDPLAAQADRLLEAALAQSGARDPREFYRERLRELKRANAAGYEDAIRHYADTLVPEVASGRMEPLAAWTEYGRILAAALAPGRTVSIDAGGRAHAYDGPERERLILHLPADQGARALLVGLPATLSAAQRATFDVLVSGRQRPSG
jgi:hypothetical protein